MADERIPAECFPVGHFLACEMAWRGWESQDVAARMTENDDEATWALTVELLVECSDDPGIMLDVDTAQRLGRAFGTSADLWLNLHRQYVAWRAAKSQSTQFSTQEKP